MAAMTKDLGATEIDQLHLDPPLAAIRLDVRHLNSGAKYNDSLLQSEDRLVVRYQHISQCKSKINL